MLLKLSCVLFFISANVFSQETQRIYLSGKDASHTVKWDFYCTDGQNSGKWSKIEVPSNWELQGFGNYNYGHDWKNKDKKLGKEHGLYKYSFQVPSEWKGKHIEIVFRGAMTDTDVKINGKSAGEIHQGGFNPFRYDISSLLKYGGDNLIEADVAKHSTNTSVNQAEREADFWIFGGIYRPVYLEVYPKTFLRRTAINARADGSFKSLVEIEGKVKQGTILCELFTMKDEKIGETISVKVPEDSYKVEFDANFSGIKPWDQEHPNLYKVHFSLLENEKIVHEKMERIGFRTIELRLKDGFYLNGRKIIFKGVNRHSFRPETGRCLSDKDHLEDISLMKEMNMNAVRMSHYQPDKRFLELCDSLGMFVLDELTGWQQGYDTLVGPKRIRELVLSDENHPCVVVWDHGNEGGWNFANEKWFHVYDIQKRPVIYPWLHRNGVDCMHYISYDFGINRFTRGTDVFMPTEFLHGMFDGGSGAGLADFWGQFSKNPRFAGGFLWVFADEAVLRTDMDSLVFDSDGNHAPDGILGPHHEKEGSFYAIREIWSPVQVEPTVVNEQWNGCLWLRNDYLFSNLKECSFHWELSRFENTGKEKILNSGNIQGPDTEPGETRKLNIGFQGQLQNAQILKLSAIDKAGREICAWTWPVIQPREILKTNNLVPISSTNQVKSEIKEDDLYVQAGEIQYVFSLKKGNLEQVLKNSDKISISGGAIPVGISSTVTGVNYTNTSEGLELTVKFDKYPHEIQWLVKANGLLRLKASPIRMYLENVDFIGIGLNYPEEKCNGVKWLGNGPYHVWKNRLQGVRFGLWEKAYNNTVTGESFNKLIYPEFKGYHSNLYWVELQTQEGSFSVYTEKANLFMHLFTPQTPKFVAGGTMPPFPANNISFLYEIPAIGTKFKLSHQVGGPTSQKGTDAYNPGQDNDPIILWFDFSNHKFN